MAQGDYDPSVGDAPAVPGAFTGGATNLSADEARSYFQTLLHRNPTDGELAQFTGMPRDQAYSAIRGMQTPDAGRVGDGSGQTPVPVDTGSGGGGGGGGGGLGSVGSLISPFTGSAPALPGSGTGYIPPTPEFHPPAYTPPPAFSYDAFKAPTGETVMNEPGFQFGLDQGLQGLQQSAAARGVLNGGGTLKDVAAWANNYGSQKYGDAYNREATTYGMNRANALGNYNTNYQTQYTDPYNYAFQGAQAAFAPQMQGYATQAAAGQRANEFNYGAAYDQYKDSYQQYLDQQNLLYNYRRPFLEG